MRGKVTLALFTHPVCSGCSEAYDRVQAFAGDREDVTVELYSLAGRSGRELARRWKVDLVQPQELHPILSGCQRVVPFW